MNLFAYSQYAMIRPGMVVGVAREQSQFRAQMFVYESGKGLETYEISSD